MYTSHSKVSSVQFVYAWLGIFIAGMWALGCGSKGRDSETPGAVTPKATSVTSSGGAIRVNNKVGVLTTSQDDPWVSGQLEVISASRFFTGGVSVKKVNDVATARNALKELSRDGCKFVVLLLPPETLDAETILKDANAVNLKTCALHWALFDRANHPITLPFVGIHENQVADSLGQAAIKVKDLEGLKCLFVGRAVQHAEFFTRADATLRTKFASVKIAHCDVAANQPIDAYKAPVLKSVGANATSKWLVMGIDDAAALGAAKALHEAGSPRVLAFGVGGSPLAQDAWAKKLPYALEASVLLSPYSELRVLAKSLAKWESTNTPFNNTKIGGTVIQSDTYEGLVKGTLMPTEADKS